MTNESDPVVLRVNNPGSFTLHYAIWPFLLLIMLIAMVWLLVYISGLLSQGRSMKSDRDGCTSFCVTHDKTIIVHSSDEAHQFVSTVNI
jgi:hypothetical protein